MKADLTSATYKNMSLVYAPVVELADTRDLKSRGSDPVPVRVRFGAPEQSLISLAKLKTDYLSKERTEANVEVHYLLRL